MAFNTINRLKWTGKLGRCEIVILHRGAPDDKRIVPGAMVTQVKKSCFYYKDGDREGFIPMHRVQEIRLDGETIWKRSTREG